jgi:hypothetical protein
MSTTETTTQTTTETIHPQRKQRRWLWPVATAAALFVGIGVGGAGATTPEPEVRTETVEVEGPTVEVEKVVVPAECVAALDDADGLMTISAEFATQTSTAMEIAQDAILAAASFDVAGLNDATDRLLVVNDDIGALTAQVQGSTYAVNRDACRAAG